MMSVHVRRLEGSIRHGPERLMAIDWSKAAWLVASGAAPREIMAAVGCSRSQLRRKQTGCALFRALVAQYAADIVCNGGTASLPSRSLEEMVRARLEEEIAEGNTRVALWLAERLRLFVPEEGESADHAMERLMETMSDAERKAFSRPD
jgi:hypothetical protein